MGMPFVDVAHLRWSQIHNDYLVYNRQKTGKQIRVAMESPMQTILFKHHKQAKGIFAFPLLQQGTDHEYLVVLGRYNRALLRLEKIAGIDEHLTSYVIRHTWASTAFSENIDLPVIRFQLNGIYYPQQSMLASYRVMIESAMCAAENTCDVKNHLNLFAPEGKEYARIVNFYRKYFKEICIRQFMGEFLHTETRIYQQFNSCKCKNIPWQQRCNQL